VFAEMLSSLENNWMMPFAGNRAMLLRQNRLVA
jgi:hypothetical protein